METTREFDLVTVFQHSPAIPREDGEDQDSADAFGTETRLLDQVWTPGISTGLNGMTWGWQKGIRGDDIP